MPIPTHTLYDMDKLNRWFAISSVALMVSLIWAIWEDYDRPWRGFQNDYMVAQAALAHLDYLDTRTESYQDKLDAARKKVQEAKSHAEGRAYERAELSAELLKQNALHDNAKIDYGNADAILQVTRSEFESTLSELGADAAETEVVRVRMNAEIAELAKQRKIKEHVEDLQTALLRGIKEIDAVMAEAQKRLDQLAKVMTDAESKERQYSDVLVKSLINAPLMDFTAPKGTPSRHEIQQYILPQVRQNLNYLDTYTTDRCTTCHISITDRNFTRMALARRFERAMPAVNEAMVRAGKDPLPLPDVPKVSGEFAPDLEFGSVTDYWDYLSSDQQTIYLSDLLETVNAYLVQSGRKEVKIGQPLLAHPNLDLFVDVDSAHPAVKIGCTVCHEGNPQETDFVLASHTPVDHHQEHEWAKEYYVTAALIPNTTFATVEHYWDRPMFPPKYSEAGCAKCHYRISDITEFRGRSEATRLNKGRDLFVRTGCVNCHDVDDLGQQRKVGPDLSRVASKITRDFMEQWLIHPKRFRPSTWMPHLFLQENNGEGSENSLDQDPVLRTETEVQAITEYLFTISQPYVPKTVPDGLEGNADRGRKLFKQTGCLACHANIAEFGREMIVTDLQQRAGESEAFAEALHDDKMDYVDRVSYLMEHVPSERDTVFAPETIGDRPVFTRYAPELSSVGSKLSREWLFGWLKNPSDYFSDTRMPSMRLTDQEAADLVEYLLTLRENKTFKIETFPRDASHREMADDLVFQILTSQNSARRSRMIMEDEGGELTERLISVLKNVWQEDEARSRLSGMDAPAKRMLFLGNKMVAHYGCYACHNVAGFETTPPPGTNLTTWAQKPLSQLDFGFFDHAHLHIREARPEVFGRVYRPEHEDLIFWSRGENPEESITHTHAGFAKHKMLNPRIWDRDRIRAPYDKLKMPNFYFTEDQTDALVTYLLSRRDPRISDSLRVDYDSTLTGAIAEGRNLTRSLNCVGCHNIEGNVAAIHQYHTKTVAGEVEFDEVNAPPALRGEGAKVQYPWLFTFLNQVQTLRPWLKVRMPSFTLSDDETTTLVKYFAGVSRRESDVLNEQMAAVRKYMESAHASREAGQSQDGPDPDLWFTTDALAQTADNLASYSVKNRLVLSYDVDPVDNTLDDLKDGYASVLEKARFTADLFDVEFPFAEQARPLVDEERFKLGEQFFYELKCLACHVLGDPNIEGSNSNPSAPNLSLTNNRLTQEWVYQWLQEPGTIQPGSQMPQWFGGGASAFSSYGTEDKAALEATYGRTGEEQMQLLMDFMYNAGAKNFTALQPGGLPDAGDTGGEDFGDEEEEEEEEEEDGEEEDSEPASDDDDDWGR